MNTRLRELRLESGLRQKDVAEKIGVCASSYGFYENWINKPDPETLAKLADIYGVSIDYLLGITDDFETKSLNPTVKSTYTREEQQLIEEYRKLPAESRKLVLRMVGITPTTQTTKEKRETE